MRARRPGASLPAARRRSIRRRGGAAVCRRARAVLRRGGARGGAGGVVAPRCDFATSGASPHEASPQADAVSYQMS